MTICSMRDRSPSTHADSVGEDDVVLGRLSGVGERADTPRHDLGQVEGGADEADLPRGDARHVEEVVDQPRELADLLADDLPRVHVAGLARPDGVEDVHGAGDHVERIAQLVAQHGEELVLGPVGGLGVLARRLLAGEDHRAGLGGLSLDGDVGDDSDHAGQRAALDDGVDEQAQPAALVKHVHGLAPPCVAELGQRIRRLGRAKAAPQRRPRGAHRSCGERLTSWPNALLHWSTLPSALRRQIPSPMASKVACQRRPAARSPSSARRAGAGRGRWPAAPAAPPDR